MPINVKLSLETGDYDVFSDSTIIGVAITERDAAIVQTALQLMMLRDVWQDMSDDDWGDWLSKIAVISAEFD